MRIKLALSALLLTSVLSPVNVRAEFRFDRDGNRAILYQPAGISARTTSQARVGEFEARSVADAFLAEEGHRFGIADPPVQLLHQSTTVDDLGTGRIWYRQVQHGVPVRGADALVHVNGAGEVYFASASFETDLPGSVTPALSADQTRKIAEEAARSLLPEYTSVPAELDAPELSIVPSRENGGQQTPARLAWEWHVSFPTCEGDECPVLGAYVGVDAQTGDVLYTVEDFHGLFRLVYDCGAEPNNYNCFIDAVADDGNTYGRSEGQPPRGPHPNPACVQFGSTEVDSMYELGGRMHAWVQATYGLDGANDQGGTRNESGQQQYSLYWVHTNGWDDNRVGYCPRGAQMNNEHSIFLCQGVVHPDVIGHEYGHSITDWSFDAGGGLALGIDLWDVEARALSESHSDIVGESFESDETGSADWFAGSAVPGGAWRDLTNPQEFISFGGREYEQRFYGAKFSCDNDVSTGGYYTNSSVFSHAMYLISEGGEFNGCDVEAQGIDFPTQIFFRAWRNYFGYSQNFDGAYTKLMQACHDLYDSSACAEFDRALQAVEANQAEAPYGGGICDDPLGALGEQAPPCAVSHAGDLATSQSDASPDSAFQISESVWVSLANGTAGRTVDFALLSHDPARPIWDDIPGQAIETASGTLDSTGALFAYFFTPSVEDTFDVIVDGNQDGYYQPWADEVATIVVSGVATSVEDGAVPTANVLQSVRPNPFNPTTTFSLLLRETTSLRVTVFDSAGRRVRTLADETALPPGGYDYVWQGRDDNGTQVASGIYLYRIETRRGNEMGKVTLVR